MKNFKFKYSSILNVIENKEDSCKNKLGQAYNILHQERDRLDNLVLKDRQYSEIIKDRASEGCKLMFLRNIEDYRKELNNRIFIQRDVIQKKEEEVSLIKKELLEITKEKKIMEKLKEKKLDEFNMTLKKIEESTVDQLVSYKNSLLHR